MKLSITFCSICLTLFINQDARAQGDFVDELYPVTIQQNLSPTTSVQKLKEAVLRVSRMKGDNDIQLKDIARVKFFKTSFLKGIGRMSIFFVRYSDSLPAVYDPEQFLFVDNRMHRFFLVTLSEVKVVKVKEGDHDNYLAGIYKRRGYGVFKIFNWSGKALKTMFTSPDFVSNNSVDCITYQHEDLRFENVDRNGDGFLDLYFHGIANYYCNGGENLGRLDRKPRRSKPIAFTYYFDPAKKSWHKKKVIPKHE